MWGCMRYLSPVGVSSAVDDRQLSPCVEKQHVAWTGGRAFYYYGILATEKKPQTAFYFGTTFPQLHNVGIHTQKRNVEPKEKAVRQQRSRHFRWLKYVLLLLKLQQY